MATATEANVFQETKERFQDRLKELQPYISEASDIQRVLDLMEGRSAAREAGQRATARVTQRRASGGQKRSDQFLELVRRHGSDGVSVSVAAKELQMGPNYLYRIAKDLEEEGKIRKEGQAYVEVTGSSGDQGDGGDGETE